MSMRSWVVAMSVTAVVVTGQTLVTVPVGGAEEPHGSAPSAAPTWGPVKTLANNPRGESLVVDAGNTTTIVWAKSSAGRQIMALWRPAGGSWGTPVAIGRGYAPQVAADDEGNLTVVWLTQRRGFTDGVRAAQRPADGDWSEPVRLSHDVSVPGYVPDGGELYGVAHAALGVSPSGAAVVAWDWASPEPNEPGRIQSVDQWVGGPWSEPVDVTPASGANSPEVGIAANGAVVLLYGRQASGHPQVLKARQRPTGGEWTKPATVAAEGYGPELAVDRAGNAVVVFTSNFNRVKAVYRPAAGQWRAARNLSPRGTTIQDYDLAMNGQGSVVVALVRGNGRVDLVRRPPGGRWSAPVRVVRGGTTAWDVVVGLNDARDTFLGWGGYALYGAYRPHGGTWSDRSTISRDAGVEVLEATFAEVAPDGDVVVMWEQEERPLKVRLMSGS